MGQGAGNLQTLSKTKNGGGGGGVTAADNGLSLNGTIVELGQLSGAFGNPAALLHDTEIPLINYTLALGSSFIPEGIGFLIDPNNNQVLFGDIYNTISGLQAQLDANLRNFQVFDINGSLFLDLDLADNYYGIGDLSGFGNGSHLNIDDANQLIDFQVLSNEYLSLDVINSIYSIGDINAALNGTQFGIIDNLQTASIYSGAAGNIYFQADIINGQYEFGDIEDTVHGSQINIFDATQQFNFHAATDYYFILEGGIGLYSMGDLSNSMGATKIIINDAAREVALGDVSGLRNGAEIFVNDNLKTFRFQNAATGQTYLDADYSNDRYQFGDISTTFNGIFLEIDDANMIARITQSLVNDFLRLDTNLNLYEIGDINGIANNSFLTVDDNTRGLIFKSAAAGHEYLRLQGNIGLYKMGDLSLSANASQIIVDDASQQLSYFTLLGNMLEINAATLEWEIGEKINGIHFQTDIAGKLLKLKNGTNDMKIQMNGVTGFTGTVSPVTSITVNGGIVTNVS